eukprot:TRINITY_DN7506_c0_g2_i1.p1 TRINITY_DN7506_c0_g2~~TRINITY_DN7506_c0_g2_i1.p1  ORF type:complete len:383 (-),score=59.92 TRINITY_DN7506_c0_g2_i1:208-1356(-)
MTYSRERLAIARGARYGSTDLKSLRAASKSLSKVPVDALFVFGSTMIFLGLDCDMFEWPFVKRPLAMNDDEVLAIDLFSLHVCERMLDRERSQSRNMNAFFYNTESLGFPRFDQLHMDHNICIRARNASVFASLVPLLHVVMNAARCGGANDVSVRDAKTGVFALFLEGIITAESPEFTQHLHSFRLDFGPDFANANPKQLFEKFMSTTPASIEWKMQVKKRNWFSNLLRFRGITRRKSRNEQFSHMDSLLHDVDEDDFADPKRTSCKTGLDATWTTDLLLLEVSQMMKKPLAKHNESQSFKDIEEGTQSIADLDVSEAKKAARDAGATIVTMAVQLLRITELHIKYRMLDYCETPIFVEPCEIDPGSQQPARLSAVPSSKS